MPKIAVLLAAFNGSQWLKEQIESIVRQEKVEISLFINVDSSSDGTEVLVSDLCIQHPQIQHLELGKHFGGAAQNFYHLLSNVDFHSYDFVALADQDDIWLPNKLRRATNCLSLLKAQAYSSNATAFWEDGTEVGTIKSQKQTQWDFLFEAAGAGCTYVFTKDLALQIQQFLKQKKELVNGIYLHDWLLYAFTRSKQYRWFIDDQSFIRYRQHSSNAIGVNVGMKAFIMRSRKVLSGWALGQSLLIAQALGLDSTTFIQEWKTGSRLAYLCLAKYSWQCRRKFIDKIYFGFACLGMSIVGSTIDRPSNTFGKHL
ncbi:glycosyltransferase [Polynucleobacter paneuropaeus]|nr:glycosyltransferase [Polynucleobacter paneuropaeus]